ncbi:MAG: hypothetical protein JWM93_1393 [Frankiales bacterium]|nr:hypothetical protein [Frankiales bacterium]
MRITWAIPCKFAEVVNGQATIVGAGANLFVVPQAAFPIGMGVTVVLSIAAGDGEIEGHLRGQILGPDMAPIGDALDVPGFGFPPGPNKPDGWENTVMIPIIMQWEAAEFGTYTLTFSIDERTVTVPVLVTGNGTSAGE